MIISGKLSGSAGWCDNFTLRSQSLHQRRAVWAAGTALLVITLKKVTGGWATAFLVQNRYHTDNCLATFKEEVIIKKAIIRHRRLCLRTMYLHEDLGEKHFIGGKKSICMFQSCFYQKQPIIAKALFWHLRVLCRGCCVHLLSDFHDNSDVYLIQAPNSQNHLNSHCRIQILFIKLQFNFMNFNQCSSTCTQTRAFKISVLIF